MQSFPSFSDLGSLVSIITKRDIKLKECDRPARSPFCGFVVTDTIRKPSTHSFALTSISLRDLPRLNDVKGGFLNMFASNGKNRSLLSKDNCNGNEKRHSKIGHFGKTIIVFVCPPPPKFCITIVSIDTN